MPKLDSRRVPAIMVHVPVWMATTTMAETTAGEVRSIFMIIFLLHLSILLHKTTFLFSKKLEQIRGESCSEHVCLLEDGLTCTSNTRKCECLDLYENDGEKCKAVSKNLTQSCTTDENCKQCESQILFRAS